MVQLLLKGNVIWLVSSMIRLGDLLDFGPFFKACGNNYFAEFAHILRDFSSENFLGNFYRH